MVPISTEHDVRRGYPSTTAESHTEQTRVLQITISQFRQIYLCTTSARNGKAILIIALSGYSSGSGDMGQRQHLSVDKLAELPT